MSERLKKCSTQVCESETGHKRSKVWDNDTDIDWAHLQLYHRLHWDVSQETMSLDLALRVVPHVMIQPLKKLAELNWASDLVISGNRLLYRLALALIVIYTLPPKFKKKFKFESRKLHLNCKVQTRIIWRNLEISFKFRFDYRIQVYIYTKNPTQSQIQLQSLQSLSLRSDTRSDLKFLPRCSSKLIPGACLKYSH